MEVDYQKLCVDLFGTDDVNKLTALAQTLKKEKNPRNAGRKKLLALEDVETIRNLIKNGMTLNEVADRFQTSRQIIGKYINEKTSGWLYITNDVYVSAASLHSH